MMIGSAKHTKCTNAFANLDASSSQHVEGIHFRLHCVVKFLIRMRWLFELFLRLSSFVDGFLGNQRSSSHTLRGIDHDILHKSFQRFHK